MSHTVRIATLGSAPLRLEPATPPARMVGEVIAHWRREFQQVIPDRPELVVVPEACDRPAGLPMERRLAYYRERGEAVLEFFRETAREQGWHLVYSAVRQVPDGSWRNSSVLLGPDGRIVGIYNKNHLVVEETTEGGILCGRDAPVFNTPVGRIACAICFDLNFQELRSRYAAGRPQLILFSSMYHGGLAQQWCAYSCRAYFVGAVAGHPSQIRNPFGEVIAGSSNYRDFAVTDVNLDYCMAHLDYNRERLNALKAHYGRDVSIHVPDHVGSVLITSLHPERSALEMAREFDIELLDDYFARALAHRHAPGNMEAGGTQRSGEES